MTNIKKTPAVFKSRENINRVNIVLDPIIERRKLGLLKGIGYDLSNLWGRASSTGKMTQMGAEGYIREKLEDALEWPSLNPTQCVQGEGTRLIADLRCERMREYLTQLHYPVHEQERIFRELSEINPAISYSAAEH